MRLRCCTSRTAQCHFEQGYFLSNLAYRPDIDGLRAVAVVPVILFHAGAQWLPGGFVGVDIFFVISGYLISAIILREVGQGSFTFAGFYERRIRRIIPALLVMLLVTVAIFQIVALPDQAAGAAKSGIAALLSLSNFYFWRETGYFAPAAEFLPLLHTWSLAVEEQFYLLFPPVLLIITRLRWDVRKTLLIGTLLAFAVSLWLSANKPSVAYFLLPARAWELGLGAVLAAGVVPPLRGAVLRELAPVAGLAAIVVSLFTVRSNMAFPGWVALAPCLGSALIIHDGGRSWLANNVLAARPAVFVGLLSYSLYLWHWPILAAIRVYTASVHLAPMLAVAAIPLIFFVSWLSWRYVERPFRSRTAMPWPRMARILGGGSAVALALSGLSIVMLGFPGRLTEPARLALAAASDVDPLRVPCQDGTRTAQCRFGSLEGQIAYAVIGDSHAAAIRPAVEASGVMGTAVGTLYWKPACPLLDGAVIPDHPEHIACTEFKTRMWREIERNQNLRTILLAGRWPYQILGTEPESGGSNRTFMVDGQSGEPSPEESKRAFDRSLTRTIERLQRMGRKVIVIGSIPEPGFDVPHNVATALHLGRVAAGGIRRDAVEQRLTAADSLVAGIVARHPGVRFLSIWESFCDKDVCPIERGGVPIYYDDDHLSYKGAVEVAGPALRQADGR